MNSKTDDAISMYSEQYLSGTRTEQEVFTDWTRIIEEIDFERLAAAVPAALLRSFFDFIEPIGDGSGSYRFLDGRKVFSDDERDTVSKWLMMNAAFIKSQRLLGAIGPNGTIFQMDTRNDLVHFIIALAEDMTRNPQFWENRDTHSFLLALASSITKSEEYYRKQSLEANVEFPSWRLFADCLRLALSND